MYEYATGSYLGAVTGMIDAIDSVFSDAGDFFANSKSIKDIEEAIFSEILVLRFFLLKWVLCS